MKRFLAFAPALLVLVHGLWIGPKYDRYVLPAFDGHVYAAMAESPRVFTLAPWGYRILEPWIVHLLPVSSAAVGFFWLNLIFLSGAVFLIGRWLRRVGFSSAAATLGGLTLAATPPLHAVLDYQVLVDPLTLFITAAILNELVTPHRLTLATLFAVGAITKEMCLMPLVVVPFVLSSRIGWKRSMRQSTAVGAPAIGLLILLHTTWGDEAGPKNAAFLFSLSERLVEVPLGYAMVFSGATLLGLLGLVRERSLEIRAIGCFLWFGNFLAVLANPYGFHSADLLRISLFAWTPWLPLALAGLGFSRLEMESLPVASGRGRVMASIGAMLAALGLVLGADSYRRAPSGPSPDPVAFLGRSRESLKTARALDGGEAFIFDARSGRFATPVTERFNLTEGRQQRWFLYSGFGPEAAFGSGPPEFREVAELLLPVFVPRAATMSLGLEGPEGALVAVSVAGRSIGSVPADSSSTSLAIPKDALIRGDNVVSLRVPAGAAIRVTGWTVRLPPAGR